jgi:methionyl-tRNA formyltransferase
VKVGLLSPGHHWLRPTAEKIAVEAEALGHHCELFDSSYELTSGDVLFIFGWPAKLEQAQLSKHLHNLVAHAGDLPKDRGWSPWVWGVSEGQNEIVLSWIEATDEIDAGPIYRKDRINLRGYELLPRIRAELAHQIRLTTLALIQGFPEAFLNPVPQQGMPTYRPKRQPSDSELDTNETIAQQLNRLRVVDNDCYPAFFMMNDQKYVLRIDEVPD